MITLEEVRQRAESDARTYGYHLHPDADFLHDLLEGLKRNEERYGYPSCPCRLASGKLELDRDIICPCYYRDPDVAEYGSCYCALYMTNDLYKGNKPILPIPERRPVEKQTRTSAETTVATLPVTARQNSDKITVAETSFSAIEEKLWYCKQCGYMVFREEPPYVCPICKAKREMFAQLEMCIHVRELQ